MAEKEKKGISGEAIGIGLLALAWALGKKPPPPPPGEDKVGAACSILILDAATMQPVPHNSPALVIEGSSYLVRLIVTNQSTRLGTPVAVAMDITITTRVGGVAVPPFPLFFDNQAFAAGQGFSWDLTFTVPVGSAGLVGEIVALIAQPAPPNAPISSCTEPLTIVSAAITYAATCTIQVA